MYKWDNKGQGKPGALQFMGSHRVGHNLATQQQQRQQQQQVWILEPDLLLINYKVANKKWGTARGYNSIDKQM